MLGTATSAAEQKQRRTNRFINLIKALLSELSLPTTKTVLLVVQFLSHCLMVKSTAGPGAGLESRERAMPTSLTFLVIMDVASASLRGRGG